MDTFESVERKLLHDFTVTAPNDYPSLRREIARRKVEALLAELSKPPSPRGQLLDECAHQSENRLWSMKKGA